MNPCKALAKDWNMVNVLIVDDSLLAEHALKSYFEKLNHEVVGLAKTGEIGKDMFLNLQPDLITVDAVMPGMSGQDYVRFVNDFDKENGKQTKIFMISGDEIPHTERETIRVDEYILKPVTKTKIQDALDRLEG